MNMPTNGWKNIDWISVQKKVIKWQQEIYLASNSDDIRLVRKLQHKLLCSLEAKYLAIRQVTQDNTGKVTAGVDGKKRLTPPQRLALVAELRFPTKAKPLRRVWIPKPGSDEKRPLGIPTIKDRCLQALFKLALEPEWEARFEPDSYGFRPGRNCHDAIRAIYDATIKGSKYVLDADIAKCFDKINHDYLLEKIGMKGAYKKQIKYWLKSGVLDAKTFTETTEGTPQGGVISPLLANIALHGLETILKKWIQDKPLLSRVGKPVDRNRRASTIKVVRYADDFVVIHRDKSIILEAREEIKRFLLPIGLELSAAKTRLTHTLELQSEDTAEEGFDGKVGFNFLGFTVKQFKTKHRSAKAVSGELLGSKTLFYPSKKSNNKHQSKLHDLVFINGKNLNQVELIKKLNPIIRGWASYFGVSDANTTNHLNKHDYLLYLKLRKWATRKTKSAAKSSKLWSRLGKNNWTFREKDVVLLKHIDYSNPIATYVKVRSESSPYNPKELTYWTKRIKFGVNSRVRQLLTKQKGLCKFCGLPFRFGEVMEVDHIVFFTQGGKDQYSNLQLLHRHCHDVKTAQDIKTTQDIESKD
jgi:RNA-directed DNA polymerase